MIGSTQCADIRIFNDNLVEPVEIFIVGLSAPSGQEIGTNEAATVFIISDDCKSL